MSFRPLNTGATHSTKPWRVRAGYSLALRYRHTNMAAVVLLLTTVAPATTAQQPEKPELHRPTPPVSEVRDQANLFSRAALTSARSQLDRITRETGVSIAIETIDSLNDEPPLDVARRLARRWNVDGVFILIAKKERILEQLIPKSETARLTEARQRAVRSAFLDQFHRKEFDRGLVRGIAALGENLLSETPASPKMRLPGPVESTSSIVKHFSDSAPSPKPDNARTPLIDRGRVRLTLRGARVLIAAAQSKALSIVKAPKFNVAIVDDGGHLLAFERMDEARPASVYTAITKATSAATFRQPTGPASRTTGPPPADDHSRPATDELLSLSLQSASGGRITSLEGGLPIIVDGQVIGAIGIGGGVGDQDTQVARAAIQAFLDQLSAPPASSTTADPPKQTAPG